MHIGHNGTFTAPQFDEMMSVLAGVPRVVIVNLKVPRDWEEPNNSAFAAGVQPCANGVLMDWHSVGASHQEYFWDDGIHLRPEGARVYTSMISAALG